MDVELQRVFKQVAFENISISAFVNNASYDEHQPVVLNSGITRGKTTTYGALGHGAFKSS